ncbi:type VII secretion protein [Bacillus cereus]|uniref:WXG100 family type VII secretion target n=1 Tax=Bacillus sp. AFS023182 TaxID=2033492 RepID=UPI000BF714F7|nr:WXG100 family type VII secretion target [Bacillus sp. AFS023182]PFD97146.1 type VII secretion protein [Bacillus sp. AFS023182]PGX92003.1 type VII secretion protein [Bacillus cereus]
MEIKVKPEQLEQIAKNISKMQRHSQNVQQDLNQAMFSIQMQWQGATSQRFYGEYVRSTKLMERYIHNLQETEKDLRRIAQKFRQADEEYQKKQAEKAKETPKKKKKEEKSWWEKGLDEAAEFFGVNDAIRAVTGKDPSTGKELSTKERLIAAGWTILNITPIGKVGKGIKFVGKKVGNAILDGAKKVSSKLHEGVSFLASKAKGLSNKIGDLWNKGKTKVKNDFIEAGKAFRYAMKKMGEYVPKFGGGPIPVMEGAGKIPSGGKNLLKDAYQYMKDTGEKVFGSGEKDVGIEVNGNSVRKTGIGKTGEGIPLEEVKPDVLKQIHADDKGAYGYLPNGGTAYHKPEYDFTNVEWTKEMQNIRKDYLDASKQLESNIERMTSEGFSKEDIARHVVESRNQQKIVARGDMTATERAGLEERNIKKYGNPIGPTAESMFNKIKDSYIDKGIYESDEQVWGIIIQKSMQKDDVINTLLGLVH